MSEVTFNEEVTATEFNNIAVDLGLTSFSYFENKVPYAVNQLNQITADLVSSGVLRTGANGALGCAVITSNGRANVQAGVIVFASGAKIRITNPVGVDIVHGTFIYAFYDSTTGKASLEVSETAPSGDYVLLAEVDAEGVIVDRRSGCVAKVTMSADTPNTYRELEVNLECDDSRLCEFDVDIGTSAFSYMFINTGMKNSNNGNSFYWKPSYQNALCLAEGKDMQLWMGGASLMEESLYITKEGQYIHVKLDGISGYTYTFNFVVM